MGFQKAPEEDESHALLPFFVRSGKRVEIRERDLRPFKAHQSPAKDGICMTHHNRNVNKGLTTFFCYIFFVAMA